MKYGKLLTVFVIILLMARWLRSPVISPRPNFQSTSP